MATLSTLQCSIDRRRIVPILGLAMAMGCGFKKFDDFEDKAPAVRIQASGDLTSFGNQVLGYARSQDGQVQDGAGVLSIGEGSFTLHTATFSPDGKARGDQRTGRDLEDDLGVSISGVLSIAAVPPATVGQFDGPFAWVAAPGNTRENDRVFLVDVDEFSGPTTILVPQTDPAITNFGSAVASARLTSAGNADDVVITANGKVTLWRGWPSFSGAPTIIESAGAGGRWPTGTDFTVVAVGALDLSTAEDEVVVAAPGGNYVAVLHHTDACVVGNESTCSANILELPLPSDAQDFGSALLVADVDNDGRNELVVGAPGSSGGGRVYVYALRDEHFVSAAAAPNPTPVTAAGASTFGSAFAFGEIDGGSQGLLAIGAPGSSTEGSEDAAGKIYLFNDRLNTPVSEISLADAAPGGQLGRRLAVMPFRVDGTVHDILVASAFRTVYAFFASVTPTHEDIRAL